MEDSINVLSDAVALTGSLAALIDTISPVGVE
jgi:hypothetical protein